jgi:hypothetical protein
MARLSGGAIPFPYNVEVMEELYDDNFEPTEQGKQLK